MALPKLLQKLFTNGGAGDKLNQDIIPDIPYSKVTDAPSVDSALSSTSENPVQNKVINSALDGKLSTSGGTMTGDIQFSAGDIWFNRQTLGIRGTTNDTYLEICPGPTSNFSSKTGASLMMAGRDYTGNFIPKGCFFLTAASEANGNKSLVGYPSGSLTWGGNEVARVVSSGKSADGTQWYRKYNDGYIEQGGYYDKGSYDHFLSLPITFLTPFSGANYSITANSGTTLDQLLDGTLGIFGQSATTVGIKFWGDSTNIKVRYIYWHACGY